MRRVPHHFLERRDSGALGTDLPYPSDSGEALDGGEVDYGAGDGKIPPAKRALEQDGGSGDGGAARQAPGGPDIHSKKPRFITGLTTGVGTCRHYERQGDGGSRATLGRGRAGQDGFGQFTTLATVVQGEEWRAEADCKRLHRVAGQWGGGGGVGQI